MTVKIYKSLLSNQVIDSLLDFFNSNTSLHYDTMGMIKIGQPWNHIQHILEPILKKYIPVDKNLGDNFYKHSFPYFTHVDSGNNKNSYNVLIPLYVSNNIEQKFVVFDQYCTDYSGATWLGDIWKPEQDFNLNKKRDFPYKDPTVVGCTDQPISDDMYHFIKVKINNQQSFKDMNTIINLI